MENRNLQKENILIVDDNNKNLQVLGTILHEKGYRVSVAQDGYKAIEIAEKTVPSLVLLDVMMPGIDGFEVCENLKSKANTRSIPIIFLTAKAEAEDIVEGFKKGGVDYLTKPFRKEELLARVRTHLELERARRLLKEQNKELESINAVKDRVFSIISHDLRSPLASFKLLLEVILNSNNNLTKEDLMEGIADMKKNTEEIYNVLNNLLTWAKNEMQGIEHESVVFDINDIIINVNHFLKISADRKSIVIQINTEKNLTVIADIEMTTTIYRNLLNNALKFSHKNSKIEIDASRKKDFVELSVKDYGKGIKKQDKNKILEETEFLTTRGTANEIGSGIGLKLCKNFVERNKGKLWFESEEGKGSKFYFTLPVAED